MSLRGINTVKGRRLECLRHLANGLTIPEIASEMYISEDSVKSHLQIAYRELGARNGPHAVGIAMVRGLIQPHEVPLPAPRAPLKKGVKS
ncbi:response regulator transcription factor [Streptomyces johnsoniae]|uniref:Helix-turn-helix transcriptional regulator n=1 Tax=Streptomyces johnsoniae TaxID=3075532 RepID=A0ABU2S3Z2_9ACTN|nr:helix-turn-helix transcriptional regulator [Streptomyces sp. DSM 41886]MDT0442335.1 helix-turn-helix transcriptional regulator [Streptomyces sp. DSM 41886]